MLLEGSLSSLSELIKPNPSLGNLSSSSLAMVFFGETGLLRGPHLIFIFSDFWWAFIKLLNEICFGRTLLLLSGYSWRLLFLFFFVLRVLLHFLLHFLYFWISESLWVLSNCQVYLKPFLHSLLIQNQLHWWLIGNAEFLFILSHLARLWFLLDLRFWLLDRLVWLTSSKFRLSFSIDDLAIFI